MWLRIALFVAVITALVGLTHYYVWVRLVRDPAFPAPWNIIGHGVVALLAASIVLGFIVTRGQRDAAAPIAWVTFIWMGVLFYLIVFLGAADLVRAALTIARKFSGDGPLDPERRVAIARILAGTVGFAAAAVSGTAH